MKQDGSTYYSYTVVYVDDILCIYENPGKIMNKIASIYRMKEDSIGPPKIYIGANVKKCHFKKKMAWTQNAGQHFQKATPKKQLV